MDRVLRRASAGVRYNRTSETGVEGVVMSYKSQVVRVEDAVFTPPDNSLAAVLQAYYSSEGWHSVYKKYGSQLARENYRWKRIIMKRFGVNRRMVFRHFTADRLRPIFTSTYGVWGDQIKVSFNK